MLLKNGIDLTSQFKITNSSQKSINESWEPVLGEQSVIKNNYNELTINLEQIASGIKLNIIFMELSIVDGNMEGHKKRPYYL